MRQTKRPSGNRNWLLNGRPCGSCAPCWTAAGQMCSSAGMVQKRERAGPAVRSRCCWRKMRSRKPCDRILRPCCGRPARWKKSGAIRCGSVSCLPGGTGLSCGAWPWPALSCLCPVQPRSFACVAVGLALPRLPGCPKPSCRAGQGRMAGRQATTAAYASRRKPVSGSIPGTGRPCCGTGWHRKMRRPKGRQGQREGRGRN